MKKNEANGKKKIDELDAVKIAAAGGTAKKKVGRKSNAELAAEKEAAEMEVLENMPDSDTFEGILEFLFNVLAGRLGPLWVLSDSEKSKGSVLLNNVAAKYFPLIGEYGPEVALLMWVAPVVLVRMQLTLALEEAAIKQKGEAETKNEAKGARADG